jgi:hypothetical protein
MKICRPSLRERLIGMGLLRPQDHAETASARERCFLYLQHQPRKTGLFLSVIDRQLSVAILKRWMSL